MPTLRYLDHEPEIGANVQLDETAWVSGHVVIEGPALLGARAVARADHEYVRLGPRCFIGAGTSIHVDSGYPTILGGDVWIGAGSVVHGARIGEATRLEDGAYALSGSEVGAGSVLAAGCLVTERASFPDNSYLVGVPAKRTRDTTPEERAETRRMVAEALAQA